MSTLNLIYSIYKCISRHGTLYNFFSEPPFDHGLAIFRKVSSSSESFTGEEKMQPVNVIRPHLIVWDRWEDWLSL